MIVDTVYGRRGMGFCLPGSIILILGDPGNLFANRSHLETVGIHPGPLAGTLKCLFVESGTTGGHYYSIQAEIVDILFNHLLTRVRAHEFIVSGNHYIL